MTRDEVMELEAGRKMDEMIAKEILGFERLPFPAVPSWQRPTDNGPEGWYDIPPFSTDAASAFVVLDKFYKFVIEKGHTGADYYFVKIWANEYGGAKNANAQTLPLAICRAALLAAQ